MKNITLKTIKLIALLMLFISFSSCEQDSVSPNSPFVFGGYEDDTYPTNEYGDVTFWTNTYVYGTITVNLYDYNYNFITSRTISSYYNSSPGCGASYAANFYGIEEGYYYYYATSNSTNYYWQSSLYVSEGCSTVLLD